MSFYKGSERVLYLLVDTDYIPVGCLTDNSFTETVDMIDTTTQENNGWSTSRPTTQSFSVDFTGIQINTLFINGDFGKVSYDYLKEIKRARTLSTWRLSTLNGVFIEDFRGYITDLGESASMGDVLTFDGSIQGYGEPESTSDPKTFDNNTVTFDTTTITFDKD